MEKQKLLNRIIGRIRIKFCNTNEGKKAEELTELEMIARLPPISGENLKSWLVLPERETIIDAFMKYPKGELVNYYKSNIDNIEGEMLTALLHEMIAKGVDESIMNEISNDMKNEG
jgi:hypothetical protein